MIHIAESIVFYDEQHQASEALALCEKMNRLYAEYGVSSSVVPVFKSEMHRVCSSCNETKDLVTGFYSDRKGTYHYVCKECMKKARKERYRIAKEKKS